MGCGNSTQSIQKKYGNNGIQYILDRYRERKVLQKVNDQIQRLKDHAKLQKDQDVEFINQQIRELERGFKQAKNEAEIKKKGSVRQAQAKTKKRAQQFSGYNQELVKLQKLLKTVQDKHDNEVIKLEAQVREDIRKQQGTSTGVKKVPDYDNATDSHKRDLENQCANKYPARVKSFETTGLQRSITWQNYKQKFTQILDRQQVRSETQSGIKTVKGNIIPGGSPVCC